MEVRDHLLCMEMYGVCYAAQMDRGASGAFLHAQWRLVRITAAFPAELHAGPSAGLWVNSKMQLYQPLAEGLAKNMRGNIRKVLESE